MIETMTFEEQVRKRTPMYIRNEGVIGLLNGVILDCIELCKTDEITFEISILGDNDFKFVVQSQHNLQPFIEQFAQDTKESPHYFPNYFPKVLNVLSDRFEIQTENNSKTTIYFSIDKAVLPKTDIDYVKFSESVFQIALLNRQCEIITVDKRRKYLTQNYYHFPQGIFYLFERATTEVLGTPQFMIRFDGKIHSYAFQIGLAYRTDWFPTPNIISFANDIHTSCGGSLVDGVLDGLISACRKYAKENNLSTFKVSRKKLLNGLILLCAVRGQEFSYGGSWKQSLEDETVRKEVKKLISTLALGFFTNQKEKADKFLWRFDTAQLTSSMY